MGKIFCVEFQRYHLKFYTKYHTHTLEDAISIQHWNFKSSYIYLRARKRFGNTPCQPSIHTLPLTSLCWGCCNIRNPSKTHIELKPHEISPARNIHFNCPIVLRFAQCMAGSITTVLTLLPCSLQSVNTIEQMRNKSCNSWFYACHKSDIGELLGRQTVLLNGYAHPWLNFSKPDNSLILEAEAKYPRFCTPFSISFSGQNFGQNFTEICSWGSSWQ